MAADTTRENVRIAVIGHFGGVTPFKDGQVIKTMAAYDALKRYGIEHIDKIDSYYASRKPFQFFCDFFHGIIRNDKFVVILSKKGKRILFPLLYFSSKYLKKEIYHYALGGLLAQEVQGNPKRIKYISSFRKNWLESHALVHELQDLGVGNAAYLPNLKKLTVLTQEELPDEFSEPYKLCIFSRVTIEKGIEDAIKTVREINAEAGRVIVTLDMYGPTEPETYLERLNEILKNDTVCRYCGVIPENKSVEILRDYYVLLFPTHYRYEGIPGTIIDALSAGLPVISRRWQFCDEMLTDGYTGLIYDFDQPEQLKEKILYAINHKSEIVQMKKNCLKSAEPYREENVIRQIAEEMGIS